MIAACIVCYWQSGPTGVKQLLKKAFDFKKIRNKRWYLPILGLMPLIGLISYALLHLVGAPLPEPGPSTPDGTGLFILFFIGDARGWAGQLRHRPDAKRWERCGQVWFWASFG
jgi:hypothetical protein